MENKYNIEDSERLDALDELIVNELAAEQRLRQQMRSWDEAQRRQEQRRRTQRRVRLVPIISNILSVAALMTVGFILQALMPKLVASTNTLPAVINAPVGTPASTADDAIAPILPADSSMLQD